MISAKGNQFTKLFRKKLAGKVNKNVQFNLWLLMIYSPDSFNLMRVWWRSLITSSLSKNTSEMLKLSIFINSTAGINMTIKTKVQIVIIGFHYRTKLTNKNVAHCFYFLVPIIRRACCAVATGVDDIAHSAVEIKAVTVAWSWTSNTNWIINYFD